MRHKQVNPKSSKVKYRLYSQAALTSAFQAVKEHGISVRKAATLYNIPMTTLRDRIDGRTALDTTSSGPDPLLSHDEEARLVDHIKYMSRLGYGYTRSQILEHATDLAVSVGKIEKSRPLSLAWFYNFMNRWPEMHNVKPRGTSAIRAKCVSPSCIDAYYLELKKMIEKYNIDFKPESIYSIDIKGIRTEHKPQCSTSKDTSAQPKSPPEGYNTTIIGCGNALGRHVPPFFIFSGKRKVDQLLEGAIPGTDCEVTESGWSNTEIFEHYVKVHFTKFVQPKLYEYILVMYDGHACHVSLSLIDWAKERRIILFLLPPHCSHILQPLDTGCFAHFKHFYDQECSAYLKKNPGHTVKRHDVCKLACKAYSLSLSPENLCASYYKSGIYPLNPKARPLTRLKPSPKLQISDEKDEASDNDSDDNAVSDNHGSGSENDENDNNENNTVNDNDDNSDSDDGSENDSENDDHSDDGSENDSENDDNSNDSNTSSDNIENSDNPKEIDKNNPHLSVVTVAKHDSYRNIFKPVQTQSKTSKTDSSSAKQPSKTKGNTIKRKAPVSTSANKPSPSKCSRSDSQESGQSSHAVNDADSSDSDTSDKGDCCVCRKNSPPGLKDCLDLTIVKWAQCDKCDHWTHLRFCSKTRVVRRHSEFFCPHCIT